MSPRTPKENEQIRKKRREEILAAAVKVFATRGYTATRLSDVAAEAKISQGLIYHYFGSKEEIYCELAGQIRDSSASLSRFSDKDASPREKIRSALSLMLNTVWTHPEYYILAVQVMTTEDVAPSAVEQVRKGALAAQEAIAQLIAEGQAVGIFRSGDPHQHFNLLYATINGLAIAYVFSRQLMADVDADLIMRLIEP